MKIIQAVLLQEFPLELMAIGTTTQSGIQMNM